MVESIRHESFYLTGTWVDEPLGVYVGWVTRKGCFSERMPLCDAERDVTLVFSGEDYPEPAMLESFKKRRAASELEGPSYLLDLYAAEPNFPANLNGRFHAMLVDRRRGMAMLFNDRYGMHKICYHESNDAFYFAAEAKAILAVRPELRSADLRSLGEFVACSCVLENRTIFRNVHVLPPASAWVFRKASIEKKGTYFHPREWEEQETLEPEAYYQRLRHVFSKNLTRYFNGHEPIGMTLTGGLDTRAIMAWHKSPPGSLPCYTFRGMYRDCQDVTVARRIATLCRQSHEVTTVGEDFLKRFPYYAERSVYLTEGGVDLSRASDLYVSEKARQIAPVKIVGTYGSEIVRHAIMFRPMAPPTGLYRPEFLSCVSQAGDTYRELRREHPVTFAAFRQSPSYHYGILALEQSQLTVRSPYLDNDFVRTVFRAPKLNGPTDDVRLRLIYDGDPALARIPTDRGRGGDSGRLAGTASQLLHTFLDKVEYAYDYGMPHWAARIERLFSACHFERLLLGRHNLLHFRIWYRDPLSEYVRQILLDPLALSRSYIERKGLERIVRGHLRGDCNYTIEIHKLLAFELLHRQFIDPR